MGGTRMNDEKEVELAKETFLKLGWDIYDERDVEVLSEAFKSHGKAMFEKGMNTCAEMSTHLGLLPINSIMKCKDCVHWTPWLDNLGECLSKKFRLGYQVVRSEVAKDRGGDFMSMTEEDFGCVHFEVKK